VPSRKPQEPTVGRIVHYQATEGDRPCAALIVAVYPRGVNLEVFGPTGVNVHRQHVPFAEEPTPAHWSWPPRD
jgi:hypothetical protein